MKRNPFFAVAILLTMIVGCTERNPTYTDIGGIVKKDLGRRDGTIKKDRGTVKKDKGTVKKDKGTVKKDKGTVKKDKGNVKLDKGNVKLDKGNVKLDKGTPVKDKGPAKEGILPPDLMPPPDTKPAPDLVPPPDQFIPPDTVAWQCTKNFDCNDNIICTIDVCTAAKKCSNTLVPGACLVKSDCHKTGELNPLNSCELCAPTSSVNSWTPKANGLGCKSDGLWCTVDSCQGGKCANQANGTSCLISGSCYSNKNLNPKNPCQMCDATKTKAAWSNSKDGTPCTGDGHGCTTDLCSGGKCTHKLSSGCMINNKCVSEGVADTSNSCQECVSAISTTAYTFISGKVCSSGGTSKMCAAFSCRTISAKNVDATSSTSNTTLLSVANVPAAKGFWAAGIFRQSYYNDDGVLVDVSTVGSSGGANKITTSAPFRAISHNLAVGDSGNFYAFAALTWSPASALKTAMGNHTRYGLWGTALSSKEVYYAVGRQSGTTGIVRCESTGLISGTVTCVKHSGVPSNAYAGGVTGTLKSGAQGPLWAIRTGSSASDDIFYNAGSGTSWTRGGPHGCQDSGSNPCANSGTDWRDIFALSSSEVWVVGSNGWILRYNGSKWSRIQSAFANQNYHDLTAVYGSAKEKLVTIATSVNISGGSHQVRLFNYNLTLGKWYGPINIQNGSSLGTTNRIYDIAGEDYQDVWLVGRRRSGSGIGAKTRGWVVNVK